MRTAQTCRNSLIKNHGFSPEEADELVAQTWAEKARLTSEGKVQASDLVHAMEQEFDSERLANIKARQNTANSIRLYKEIQSRWSSLRETDDFKTGKLDFVEFMSAELVGEGTRFTGSRHSVDAAMTGLYGSRRGMLDNAFEQLGEKYGQNKNFVLKTLSDPRAVVEQMDFLKEVYSPGSTQNPMMAEVATVWRNMAEDLRVRGNMAGGDTGKLPHGYFPQNHSVTRMVKAGVDKWVEFITPLLDWDATMPDVAPADRAGVLSSMFRTISLNRDLQMHNVDYPMPRTKGNTRHRVLHFRDGESFFKYHSNFGEGSLIHAMDNHVRQATNRVVLMERLGTKPEDLVSRLVEGEKARLRYVYEDTTLPEATRVKASKDLHRLQGAYDTKYTNNPSGFIANQMKVLMGETRSPVNITGAKIGHVFRSLNVLKHMGLSGLSSIMDIATTVTRQRAWGGDLARAYIDAPASYFKSYKGDTRRLMKEIGFLANSMWGGLASRFDIANVEPGVLTKLVNSYYKWSGVSPMSEATKTGHAMFLSRLSGLSKDLEWKALDPDFRRGLEYHGFNEGSWKLMRNMMEKIDGEYYLSPTMAQRLTDHQLSEFLPDNLRTKPKGMSQEKFDLARKREFYRMRNKIETDVLAMFSDDAKFGTMDPDARAQVAITQGTRPGTVVGELLRGIGQFKSWPIMMWQRQVKGQTWKRHSVTGVDVPGMVNFVLLSLATAYLATSLKDLARGRTPRDIANWETLLTASWQAGFFGLYGDFVFGPQMGMGGALSNAILGPTGGMLNELSDVPGELIRGEFGKARDRLAKTTVENIPYMNLWFTKAAADYFILNEMKELISPGYKARMVRNMEQTFGQRPLW